MAGPTTVGWTQRTAITGDIDDAVNRFLAASRYTLQERPGVVASSIQRIKLPEGQGPSVDIPKFGTVTTYALTQGVDMAQAQEISDTLMQIVPSEYGAQVVLSDMLLMTVRDEFFAVAGRILGDSFDRQREETLCDDFDSYSLNLGTTTGVVLNVGNVMAANASIKYNAPADASAGRGGEPAPDPVYGVFTPSQIHALRKTMVGGIGATGVTQVPPDLARTRFAGEFEVGGVNIRSSININKDTNDDAKGAIFSEQAQILVELGDAPGAEKERDASLRGWEVNFVGRWARGEYDDDWGRECLYDSALPTS